ncbi:hypothetical protein [Paractinoplanes rishiriensis]|uniref:Uncharacterized protein n=1 Tax=Paractinoplanes rishiriensis TaxID=1050105 RepID=A0A919K7F3_9ACTN|nr:hypothetical protein [Actinoplanes rishiriensis]GIF01459.1 hypothetical protein Ari01nite_89230 [Actinoplanes rishiriensis]
MPGASSNTLFPLSDLISAEQFPLAEVLDGLYYTQAEAFPAGDDLVLLLTLTFERELAFGIPGVDDLAVVFGSAGAGWTSLTVELVLGPSPSISLRDVDIALRVPASVLRDVATGGPAEIHCAASVTVDAEGNVTVETDAALSLAEAEIAGSGVTISATNVTWNFERGRGLPTAEAAGLPGEFLGIAFEQATVTLPAEVAGAPTLTLDHCCVGTGGFTGGLSVTFDAPPACQFGGFTVELERVGIRFVRSRLVLGQIESVVRDLDFFDTDLAVDLQLSAAGIRLALATAAGRLRGSATLTDGLVTVRKPGVVAMTLTGVTLEIGAAESALSLSGTIRPEIGLPGSGPLPPFTVDALRISSTGTVSVAGGWLALPAAARVELGGFTLTLTKVGLGSEPSGDRWIGFSGTLSLVSGIPVTAAVDGLRLRWNAGGLTGVELAGVAVHLEVENVLVLDAQVRYHAEDQRFDGAGTLRLVSVNLTVSVRVVVGRRADYTYLYVYLLVQLPVGVPLFSTGLGLYGFEALYARNMAPDKDPAERWYRDWYRRPEIGAADQSKWADERGSQGFGAGVILGTMSDTGYTVAVKGLLVVVVPGPILMLDVRANLLKDPTAIAAPQAQALFTSLVVFDGRAGTLELGIEPHYAYPDDGRLVDVTGVAEAFYNFSDPRAWHLYLGRREPEQRIRARLLSIFDANTYLMVDANQIELGGFIGWQAQYAFGPVRLGLEAWIEGMALVSRQPKQLRGELSLHGSVGLSVFGIGFDLSVTAMLAVQSPDPFEVTAALRVKVDLPWPLPDFEKSVRLRWAEPAPPRLADPLQTGGIEHLRTTASWPFGAEAPTVPLDGRISLAFATPVEDAVRAAANREGPVDQRVGEFTLRSRLTGLRLDVLDESTGTYIPYASPDGTARPLSAMWQRQAGDPSFGNRHLMLGVRTPYERTRAVTEPAVTQLEEAEEFDPCRPAAPVRVLTFEHHPVRRLEPLTAYDGGDAVWTPGPAGADILPISAASAAYPVRREPPRRYPRCLFVPDQWGIVPVPGATGRIAVPLAPAPALRLDLPAAAEGLAVLVMTTGTWSLTGYDAAGAVVATVSAPVPAGPGGFHADQLVLRGSGLRTVALNCYSRLLVLAVAVRTEPPAAQTATRRTELQQTLERFRGSEPVFEPYRQYRLTVTTQVVETGGRSLAGAEVEAPAGATASITGAICTITRTFDFRTEGPPEDTLEPYVTGLAPARGAPAVYRDYDLAVTFGADYVDHMYLISGRMLGLRLRAGDGTGQTLTSTTVPGAELVLRREERTWLATLDRSSCALTVAESELTREVLIRGALPAGAPLEPRTSYDAELVGEPAGPAPRPATGALCAWSFVTSRYRTFADHVRPHGTMRLATPQLSRTEWSAVLEPVLAAPGTVRREVQTAVFTALFAALDVERSLPAETGLHAVGAGGETWALLLSSPEPFDPDRVRFTVRRRIGVTAFDVATSPVPDADGTRVLLVPHTGPAAGLLADGKYLVTGLFRRNIGAGQPVLSVQGDTGDETATVEIELPIA